MNLTGSNADKTFNYELRYASSRGRGGGFVFPCSESGQVDMNRLSDHRRNDYFYARAVAGNQLEFPVVTPIVDDGCGTAAGRGRSSAS